MAPQSAMKSTYSRGADGRTSLRVPDYRRKMDTLAQQTSASLLQGNYMDAQANDTMIEAVVQEERAFRLQEEQKRQSGERVALNKAFGVESDGFTKEWAARIQAVESECEEKISIMEEVHEVRRADFDRKLSAKVAGMRYRASLKLLELEDQERRLARSKEYGGAAEIAGRAARLRGREVSAFEAQRKKEEAKPCAELDVALQVEMNSLHHRCHALRLNVKREKAQAYSVFEQRYRNLDADLSHAHAIEYHLPVEVGPVLAYPSRSAHSSTFRGSLKLGSVAGTKFDVKAV